MTKFKAGQYWKTPYGNIYQIKTVGPSRIVLTNGADRHLDGTYGSGAYPQHNLTEQVIVTPAPKPLNGKIIVYLSHDKKPHVIRGDLWDQWAMGSEPDLRILAVVDWEEGQGL